MDILSLLDRCAGLERAAASVYDVLAQNFRDDAELHALWVGMAGEEHEHAHKLETWRALVAAEAPERRIVATGFEAGVTQLEDLLAQARAAAERTERMEESFALALALELSELDAIYTTLLQSSPIARFPDLAETVRRETAGHHDGLVQAVKHRSRDEGNLLRAAMLDLRHAR